MAFGPHAGPADGVAAAQQVPSSSHIQAACGADAVRTALHGADGPAAAAAQLALFFGSVDSSSRSVAPSSAAGSLHGASWAGSGAFAPARAGNSRGVATPSTVCSSCRCRDTTLGVILPHAVSNGAAGRMLMEVQAAFDVSGLQLFRLDRQAAAEFLQVSAQPSRPRSRGRQVVGEIPKPPRHQSRPRPRPSNMPPAPCGAFASRLSLPAPQAC